MHVHEMARVKLAVACLLPAYTETHSVSSWMLQTNGDVQASTDTWDFQEMLAFLGNW